MKEPGEEPLPRLSRRFCIKTNKPEKGLPRKPRIGSFRGSFFYAVTKYRMDKLAIRYGLKNALYILDLTNSML